ncbi:hypothetical protein GQ600_25917 [Phytophthora cactorum]|nr:hypothetical protein GQ600_25917 [Phytophthora cactorum]
MAVHEVHLSHGVLRQRLQWVFDCKRVHFRPKLLPDTVKSHITEKFHGVILEGPAEIYEADRLEHIRDFASTFGLVLLSAPKKTESILSSHNF